jgi:hypothetical protein
LDVVVERGRLDAKLTGDCGKGGGFEPITISNGRCRLHNVFERDPRFSTHQTIGGVLASTRSFIATFMASNPPLVLRSREFHSSGTRTPLKFL